MARCQLSNEDECYGHDCIMRVGTPCVYDTHRQAGTDDIEVEEGVDYENYDDYSEDE